MPSDTLTLTALQRRSWVRAGLALGLLLALALRVLVPPGFMPASAGPDASWFVFCGGDTRSAAILQSLLEDHLAQTDEAQTTHEACEFGVLTAPVIADVDASSSVLDFAAATPASSRDDAYFPLSFPRYGPTRAPPIFLDT